MIEEASNIYDECFKTSGKLKGAEVFLQEYLNSKGVPIFNSYDKCGEILRNETFIEDHMKNYYGDK